MTAQTIFIEGPMHPDLFDGETPIMMAVPIDEACDVFSVGVEYSITDEEYCTVLAANEKEASDIATELFHSEHGFGDAEIIDTSARMVERNGPWGKVTEEMVTQYQNYKANA